ncbi:YibE/F family protein [Streptomyces sp. TRM43335]|uniref:YibE/F family protein n=1 Tax=Streptomyces taklimakanensis TaxID=2569853 RepID=A0A6G2BCR2_9ACTN|nr:YibE/F family protein [Streptomyces taklimakanensis]
MPLAGPCDDRAVDSSPPQPPPQPPLQPPSRTPSRAPSTPPAPSVHGSVPRPPREHGSEHGHGPGHGSGHGSGHGHGHHHGPPAPVSARLRRVIAAVLVPFAVVVLTGLVALWPGGTPDGEGNSGVGFDRRTFDARVTAVEEVDCAEVGAAGGPSLGSESGGSEGASGAAGAGGTDGAGGEEGGGSCLRATVEVTEGEDAGHTFPEIVTPDATRRLSAGQGVVVAYAPQAPRELQYSVVDVRRGVPMVALGALFALAVVVVGRLRGVLALVGLVVSFGVLTLFILPAILQGSDPLLVAVVGGSTIMLATLYLCHGVNARTSVAVLGTLVSLLLIGLLGSVFIAWAALTGNTDDQTGLVHTLYPDIEIQGLLLAGVLIGSLGVLDDVTVTQTSAVWELRQADPGASWRKLYGAAMRIGRDHIASVVNTLVLAYAGAALPLLLLFSVAEDGMAQVAGSELVAEEIVRTLVGSIGLVASVPVTTALAALVAIADRGASGGGASDRGAGSAGGGEGAGGRVRRGRSGSGSRGRRRARR